MGTDFISAMGGAYDTFSEMLKYKRVGPDGLTHDFEISTPCHKASPPHLAYACFGGLISNEAELQDVYGADDGIVLVEDDYGFHSSPHQLAAIRLQLFSQACDDTKQVRLSKEVRAHNLARGENAVAKLATLGPLAFPTLPPSSKWIGEDVNGGVPINQLIEQLTLQ